MKDFNIDLTALRPQPNWRHASPGQLLLAYPKGEGGVPQTPIAGMRIVKPAGSFGTDAILALSEGNIGKVYRENDLFDDAVDIQHLATLTTSARDLRPLQSPPPICLAYLDASEHRSFWVRSVHREGGDVGWVLIHGTHPHAKVGTWVIELHKHVIFGGSPRIRVTDGDEAIFL